MILDRFLKKIGLNSWASTSPLTVNTPHMNSEGIACPLV